MDSEKITPYENITESPGLRATKEQKERIFHRYRFAADYVTGAKVLEVACGSGLGLTYLAGKAEKVVGCDINEENLCIAQRLCLDWRREQNDQKKVDVVRLDAHDLKYPDGSFDVLILFEAIYYLKDPQLFVSEARRVLAENGTLLICTVNKDWDDFHNSPYTYRYFAVPELKSLLKSQFASVDLYGAFPAQAKGMTAQLVSSIKRAAIRFNLIPGSLAMRAYLKRIFLGPVQPLPAQLDENMAIYMPPFPIPGDHPNHDYKIIYTVAKKNITP